MNFIAPDPNMLRRSECGCYLIEKVALDGTDANGAPRYKYVLWEYYRTQWSFETAADAADEARSLEDHAVEQWRRLRALAQAPGQAVDATPESELRSLADDTEQTPPA